MGSIVQLVGTVPDWIGAATGTASLYLGLRNRQQAQAIDFAQTLEQLADRTPLELRQVVEDHPVIAQILDLAWEEAARTASEHKRRLLAKVVAAATRGDADAAQLDELQFLLRTVMALDPAHVSLLVVLATPEDPSNWTADDPPEPSTMENDLQERWHAADDLLSPALAALEREGLIDGRPSVADGWGWWALRPYGRLFFDFLVRSGEAEPPTKDARQV